MRVDKKNRYQLKGLDKKLKTRVFTIAQLIEKYSKYLYELHMEKLHDQEIIATQDKKRQQEQRERLL